MTLSVKIANLVLTRRCNLKCSYCRISGNVGYQGKPIEYPDLNYYITNEKGEDFWIENINILHKHNPEIFFIIFGGEPFLYSGLEKIINHLNNNDMLYTVISNSTDDLQKIRDKVFNKVGFIRGYTASIDPGFERGLIKDKSIYQKSIFGFNTLKTLMKKKLIKDPVAELTIDSNSISYVKDTIQFLTNYGICSDITVIDVAKTPFYDFSNITDKSNLVYPTQEVKELFDELKNSNLNIHMKDTLLDKIFEILPANNNCDSCCNVRHNITIDSDGKLRLCYRIRGKFVSKYNLKDYLDSSGNPIKGISAKVGNAYAVDKQDLCRGCAWTCTVMSQLDQENINFH
jgi:MoaA/NifB/PqqE/SkfB family radical SAM enzyme